MPKSKKSETQNRILHQFDQFLHLVEAYNAKNFLKPNWRLLLPSVLDAFNATLVNCSLPFLFTMIIWNLIEKKATTAEFIVALPILASLIMTEFIFAALMWKSSIVVDTIRRLQIVIDQRQFRFFIFF